MLRIFTTFVFSFILITAFAQAPAGYYDAANGKTGYTLKTALKTIITSGHADQGYGALYTGYVAGDTDPEDGFVWDMYSENPTGADPYNYSHGQAQCGQYYNEGDCYNREHLMPQSVFSEASPMKNDFFQVVPTDGKVNGMRGNEPFGEVSNPSWTSLNGSKLGPNTTAGYTGTVFEPIDEFKGDIARSLFYFVTRYEDKIVSWNHEMLGDTKDKAFSDWFLAVLLDWHKNDPVSSKEITRNNAGYNFQGNRNPYIDHPEWVSCVWESQCSGLQFTSTPTLSAAQDQAYTYNVTFSGNGTLTLTKESGAAWLSLSNVTGSTAVLSGTPTSSDLGNNAFSLKLSDGTNSIYQNFTINVTDGNSLAFTSTPKTTAKEGTVYSYTITAIGNDGKTLSITAPTKPAWLNFASQKSSSASETLTGTPSASDLGNHAVSIELTDGTKTLHQNFTIKVSAANSADVIIISQYYEGASNDKYIELTNLSATNIDLSGYYLGRWSGTASPTGKYNDGGALSGTINAGQTIVYKHESAANPAYAPSAAFGSTLATYFNGDDPVALLQGGDTWEDRIDCIYGAVISPKWGDERSFYRKPTVTEGNLNVSTLDGSGEWVQVSLTDVANATNTATAYLGYHSTTSAGIEAIENTGNLFPNPVENTLNLQFENPFQSVEILSVTGQVLKQQSVYSQQVQLNVSNLEKGIYFVKIYFSHEKTAVKKFIKQ
jgi:endonuclease I